MLLGTVGREGGDACGNLRGEGLGSREGAEGLPITSTIHRWSRRQAAEEKCVDPRDLQESPVFMPMALSLDASQLSHLASERLRFLPCKFGIIVVRTSARQRVYCTLLGCPMRIPSIKDASQDSVH